MPRLVRIGERTPLVLQTLEDEVKVCRCGLSKALPLCDGSESLLEGEDDALTYTYDANGKRSVVEHGDARRGGSFASAWKWLLPVAYVLIPVNLLTTATGYAKLPAKMLLKGQLPGLPESFLDKTPYGYLFPVVVQIAAVLVITWLAQHPQLLKPQHWVEQVDAHVDASKKDLFFLWTRRLLGVLALLVSVFCTYISAVLIFGAFLGERGVPPQVLAFFAFLLVAIVGTWVFLVRRRFRAASAAVDASTEKN